MYMLNRAGERIPPYSTPFCILTDLSRVVEVVQAATAARCSYFIELIIKCSNLLNPFSERVFSR